MWILGLKELQFLFGVAVRAPNVASNPGVDAICGLSLLLVLSLAPRGFSLFPRHFQIPVTPVMVVKRFSIFFCKLTNNVNL